MRALLFAVLLLTSCSDVTVIDDDGTGGEGGNGGIAQPGGAPGFGGQDPCSNGTCAGGFGMGAGGAGGATLEDAIYSGENLATGVPRFVLNKAIPDRDVCVTVVVEATGGPGQYDVECNLGWSIGNIIVTDDASQCDGGNWPGNPEAVTANAATGTVVADAENVVCIVSAHLTIQFPPDAQWVQVEETFDVDDLAVMGGCD